MTITDSEQKEVLATELSVLALLPLASICADPNSSIFLNVETQLRHMFAVYVDLVFPSILFYSLRAIPEGRQGGDEVEGRR